MTTTTEKRWGRPTIKDPYIKELQAQKKQLKREIKDLDSKKYDRSFFVSDIFDKIQDRERQIAEIDKKINNILAP